MLELTKSWGGDEANNSITNVIEFANSCENKDHSMAMMNHTMGFLKDTNKNLWLNSCIDLGKLQLRQK